VPAPVTVPPEIIQLEAAAKAGIKLSKKMRDRLENYKRAQHQQQQRQRVVAQKTTASQAGRYTFNDQPQATSVQTSTRVTTGGSGRTQRRDYPFFYLYLGGAKGKEARAEVPFLPETEQNYGSLSPIGHMAQFGLDFRFNHFSRIFLDFSSHQYVRVVGRKDVLSAGPWLKETAPSTAPPGSDVGYLQNPLDEDLYMVVNGKGTRLGLKFGVPLGKVVEPWIGGGLGVYEYTLNIGDRANELSIGEASGTAFGATWMAGIDFKFPAGSFYWTLTPFLEGASPTPLIKTDIDLGGLGVHTWEAKNDIMAPLRPGLALGLAF
jgi:hypothetical protein